MPASKRSLRVLPPLLLAATLAAIYLATLARGLTWANAGADGGDLIAAAATGGVAHPTGYPTYLLIARLFQFLPIGSLAFRTNLLSAVATIFTSVLVYRLTIRFLSPENPQRYWLGGLTAGLSFGLAPLVWSQAVITEVYALNAFFTAVFLFSFELPITKCLTQKWKGALLGLIFGVGMGNHITLGFLFPLLFVAAFQPRDEMTTDGPTIARVRFDLRAFLWILLWAGAGLLVYLALPLRALSRPPVNWGNPITWRNFLWLVTGRLYQGQFLTSSVSVVGERLQALASLFLGQFGVVGFTLGLTGLIVFFRSGRFYFTLVWIAVVSMVFAVLYSTNDSYVYLIPALLGFSIWIGIGVGRGMDAIPIRRNLPALAGGAMVVVLLVQAGLNWRIVDASKDSRAENFAKDVLSTAPAGAIVFAKGDQAIFSLWYSHYALHARPDLVVIASDLLQFDWYLQTLRSTYPEVNLSEPFPFPETVIELNPNRPVCYVEYIQMPVISCQPPRGLARP